MHRLAALKIKSEENQKLVVFGTPWRFPGVSDNGEYVLDTVPQGEYMPVGIESMGLQMGQTTGTVRFDTLTDAASVTFSDPENLMLTNFENRRLLGIGIPCMWAVIGGPRPRWMGSLPGIISALHSLERFAGFFGREYFRRSPCSISGFRKNGGKLRRIQHAPTR
jgi:hypothetical protein